MTMRLSACRKAIPLTHVTVDVTHGRDHLKDCADREIKPPKIDVFTRSFFSAVKRDSVGCEASPAPTSGGRGGFRCAERG